MAKVKGPLMSLSASGSVADTIVFSIWKGRPYVRELVTPSNPQTADQAAVRSILGGIAKAARAVLTSAADQDGFGSAFFQSARDQAPSGQSWISNLHKVSYGTDTARLAAWAALNPTQQGYFDASALNVALTDYDPIYPNATAMTAGEQLFYLAYFGENTLLRGDFSDLTAPQSGEVTAFEAVVHTSNP